LSTCVDFGTITYVNMSLVRNDFECSFCHSPLVEDVTCRVLAGIVHTC